jgi:hypothetical protein
MPVPCLYSWSWRILKKTLKRALGISGEAGFAMLSFDVKEVDKESHSVGMVLCEKKKR